MIFPWLAENFTHSARSISLLCLFSTPSQYLLMLQALYTCLIYAPCISPSSSPELIPCEFSEVFLNKMSFLRSTSLGGQHHMWCAHSNCYTSAGQQSLAQDEKQNSVFAIPFFSYTQGYYVCPLGKLTLVSFLLMSRSEVRRARKAVEMFIFVQLGFFWVKSTRLKIKQNTHILVLTETSRLWRCLCTILAALTLLHTSIGRFYGYS